MDKIAKKIKERRLALGLSRDKLARITEITPKSIIAIEGGKMPSVRTLMAVADALGLELALVEKRKRRILSDIELALLVERIAIDARSGYCETFLTISDDVDIEVRYDAEVKEHQENDTGGRVVDECNVYIESLSVDAYVENTDMELPDADALARMVEKKIMEG